MTDLTKEEWKKQLSNQPDITILDVRTPLECTAGIQPGAVQLNFMDPGKFRKGIKKLNSEKPLFVYCRSGNRSSKACHILESNGFKTFNLLGGMMHWDGDIVQN